MSIIEAIALFGIMIALAALPSTSVALVVTRSATLGIPNGMAVAAGIVTGDLTFVMLAAAGLSVLAESMGYLFSAIRYLGAVYLIWLGLSLLKKRRVTGFVAVAPGNPQALAASFLAGLALTLGDVKAILFYVSLLPMFIDPGAFQASDLLLVVSITILAVGGVKAVYALLAARIASKAERSGFHTAATRTAGGIMIGAGSYMILKP